MSLADVGDARADPRAGVVPPIVFDLFFYGLVSAASLACDYTLLLLLVAAGLDYLIASAISFCTGMAVCYALSVRFVFRDRRAASRRTEIAGFLCVGVTGLVLTQIMLALLVSRAGLSVGVAKIPTTGVVFSFNFICRRSLVFMKPRRTSDPAGAGGSAWGAIRVRLASANLTWFCVGVALAAIWALGHTFAGIEADARVYMGRALADLDPLGVGRDLMFKMDGQSAFTLYGEVAKALAGSIGLGPADAVLSLVSLAAWFVAIVVFACCIAPRPALVPVLAAVVLLPRVYTPWNIIAAGEAIAVPRPLAEAGVILALAALGLGRTRLSLACLAMAALFHPLMAAPGICVLVIVLGLDDRRWLVAAALAGVGLVAAGALGAPLAARLFATIDAPWRAILLTRNPYLFLHLWPLGTFATALVQSVTIFIGGALLERRFRVVLYAAVAVAVAGCATSFLFCDLLPNLLVTQAQLWRWSWQLAALAPVAAGVCVWRLPQLGVAGHVMLAALSAAWLWTSSPLVSSMLTLTALGVFLARPPALRQAYVPIVWTLALVLAVLSVVDNLSAWLVFTKNSPAGAGMEWRTIWGLGLPTLPLALLAYGAWRWPASWITRVAAPLFALGALALLAVLFDARTPFKADADAATLKPALVATLDRRPGDVLWLGGDELWYWAHRANWNSSVQGAGLVFSRDLSRIWSDRAHAVVDAGLATRFLLEPWGADTSPPPSTVDPTKILRFCRRPDAPTWIVMPLYDGAPRPVGLETYEWSPPSAGLRTGFYKGAVYWRVFDRYLIVPCAPRDGSALPR